MLDVVWTWAVRETSREMNEKKKKVIAGLSGGKVAVESWKLFGRRESERLKSQIENRGSSLTRLLGKACQEKGKRIKTKTKGWAIILSAVKEP